MLDDFLEYSTLLFFGEIINWMDVTVGDSFKMAENERR